MLSVIMLSVIMLSVIMLSVIMLSVIMLSVVMLRIILLSVILLSVIMLNVVAPFTKVIKNAKLFCLGVKGKLLMVWGINQITSHLNNKGSFGITNCNATPLSFTLTFND
jgi:hypothetical protein